MSQRLDELERLEKAAREERTSSHSRVRHLEFTLAMQDCGPALIAIARMAEQVAECLCLPTEPEAYKTLGEHLQSSLIALEKSE